MFQNKAPQVKQRWIVLCIFLISTAILGIFQNCSQNGFEINDPNKKTGSFSTACGDEMAADISGNCILVANACTFNGFLVANNSVIAAYKQSSVTSPAICEAQSRSCKNEILSGDFGYQECVVNASQSSSPNPFIPVATQTPIAPVATQNPIAPIAATTPETPIATNVPIPVPSPESKSPCSFGGATFSDGSTMNGFNVAQVNYGESCTNHSYPVKCENGTLNPNYLLANCTEAAAKPNIVGMGGYTTTDAAGGAVFYDHGCYIVKGTLKCAGYNAYGQLGNGTLVGSVTLTAVPDFSSGVTSVAAGYLHTCVIRNGAVYCWGINSSGELGKGVIDSSKYSGPQPTLNLTAEVSQLAVGYNHSCAIKAGALYCWGNNANGKLGDTTINNNSTPKVVTGMGSDVTDVALGIQHTCAVRAGSLYCWGFNNQYQLGFGAATLIQKEPGSSQVLANVTMVATSSHGTCAISGGELYCWGFNASLQAGQGGISTANVQKPTQVGVGNLVNVKKVISNYGAHHVCVIDETSSNHFNLKCWGNNNRFQLGLGTTGNISTPTIITVGSSGNDIADVAMNLDGTCATKTNGDLYCWGTNYSGFMGVGPIATYPRYTTPRLLRNLLQ